MVRIVKRDFWTEIFTDDNLYKCHNLTVSDLVVALHLNFSPTTDNPFELLNGLGIKYDYQWDVNG